MQDLQLRALVSSADCRRVIRAAPTATTLSNSAPLVAADKIGCAATDEVLATLSASPLAGRGSSSPARELAGNSPR